jgi:predicted ATPase
VEIEMAGLFTLGASVFHLGRLGQAENHMTGALRLHAGSGGVALRLFGTPDLGLFCRVYRSHVLWMLGRSEESVAESQSALAEGRRAANPFTNVICLNYMAMLHIFRRESAPALALARESIDFCRHHGFAYYLSMAEILGGWAETFEGDAEEGCARIRQGLAGLRATGAELRLPFYLGLLSEACDACGRTAEAMAHIANAFAYESKNHENWTLPELHRIHGDLLKRGGDGGAAEAAYRKALDAARQIGARSLELRASERLG